MFLMESTVHAEEVAIHNKDKVQDLVDLINDGGQLSWVLTPQRLQQKLSHSGKLFGLYDDSGAIGVIGIKAMAVDGIMGGEIGYLYIKPDHRSLQNATMLYNIALKTASQYPFLIATTITTNRAVNTLLARSDKMYKVFTAKSPFSNNRLNYWLSYLNSGSFTLEEIEEALENEYGSNIVNESTNTLKEAITFVGIDGNAFSKELHHMVDKNPMITLRDSGDENDINIHFNKKGNLPTESNTIYVGNRYHSKLKQFNLVKNKIPTIKTLTSSEGLDNFIAKREHGWKQQGQMINQQPDDPENYVFQPFLDIVSEYRVVTYYMNGQYHVSGVYKKTGSNMSYQSITGGEVYEVAVNMAMESAKLLGYGLSGVDMAIVTHDDNIVESVGGVASAFGKLLGKFSDNTIGDDKIMVFLEANTFPSMANPMIRSDIMKHALKHKK